MKRPRHAVPAALAVAALTTALAGCASINSPAVIITPYQAADGSNYTIPGTSVRLANFVVVGIEEGSPASVVGSVINGGASAIKVDISAAGVSGTVPQAAVTVPAGGVTQVGPDQDTSLTIEELPVSPGSRIQLTAATSATGTSQFSVPVVRTVGYYENLTPSPTPSPTPRTRRSATPSESAGSNSSETEPTASAT